MDLQCNNPGDELELKRRANNEPVSKAEEAGILVQFPLPGDSDSRAESAGIEKVPAVKPSSRSDGRERFGGECLDYRLGVALKNIYERGYIGSLLVIRMTEYRVMEEIYGQCIAQDLMRRMETRLLDTLRRDHIRDVKGDIIEQVAEDEFVIVLNRIEHLEDVNSITQRLAECATDVYVLGGLELHVQCVAGVAQYPYHSRVAAELLRYARIALRQADKHSKSRCHLFTDELLIKQRNHLCMAVELEQALQQGRMILHYQPQYALESLQIISVESLVRLVLESGEIVQPNDFIPIAEESGLIIPLGNWVIREACQQLSRWRDAGCGPLRVAINVSPRQLLDESLIDVVVDAVESAGIDFCDLEIEITEQCIVDHLPTVQRVLGELNQKGVRMAVDDFGTGYSALAYIAQLPLTLIKLDRSFLSDVSCDSRASQLVTALITMAKELNLEILAEGVETLLHHQFLCDAGCELGQGFGFARPCSAEALLELVQTH